MEDETPVLFNIEGQECPMCRGVGRVPDGEELAGLRKALRVSAAHMAREMGHSAAYISQLENNRRPFTNEGLDKYMEVLEDEALQRIAEKANIRRSQEHGS